MRNIVLEISYFGLNYSGWQIQKNKLTIQGVITNLLNQILNENIKLTGSSRTDAGVSAIKQIANFNTESAVLCREIMGRLNNLLPTDIRILKCYDTSLNFHSRYNVKKKTYLYYFYLGKNNIPYYDMFAVLFKQNVNIDIFKSELKKLKGTYNFTSFCASNSAVVNKERTIYFVNIIKQNNLYCVKITGNGFLYNTIRIIIGTLVDIASNKNKLNISQIIERKDRTYAGFTAPAKGLVLYDIKY